MPLAYTINQAKQESGLGRSTLYTLIANGGLESTMIGRRRLILAKSLEKLLARGTSSLTAREGATESAPRPGIPHDQAVERGRKSAQAKRLAKRAVTRE